jgi:hypothetical protein
VITTAIKFVTLKGFISSVRPAVRAYMRVSCPLQQQRMPADYASFAVRTVPPARGYFRGIGPCLRPVSLSRCPRQPWVTGCLINNQSQSSGLAGMTFSTSPTCGRSPAIWIYGNEEISIEGTVSGAQAERSPPRAASPVRSEDARWWVLQSSSPGQWQMPDAWRSFDGTADQGGQSQPAAACPNSDAGKVGETSGRGENRRTRVRRRPHEACRNSPPHNADAASPKGSIGMGELDDPSTR